MDPVRTALSEVSVSQLAAATFAVLAMTLLGSARARRLSRVPVCRAAASADPEVRQAAVLVASCDGPARHVAALRTLKSTETDEAVLGVLAQVVRRELPKRRSTADLRQWAETYSPPRPLPPAPARLSLGSGRSSDSFAHLIDALELVDALVRRDGPKALPPGPPDRVTAPGRSWRGRPDQIDSLEVLGALAPGSAGRHGVKAAAQERKPSSPKRTWRAGPDGIDPLVVSGVKPCDCAAGPRGSGRGGRRSTV